MNKRLSWFCGAILVYVIWVACQPDEHATAPNKNRPSAFAIQSTVDDFEADAMGWISRQDTDQIRDVDCSENLYAAPHWDETDFLQLARWNTSGYNGRTWINMDFETSSIPGNAIIEAAVLTLTCFTILEKNQPTIPGALETFTKWKIGQPGPLDWTELSNGASFTGAWRAGCGGSQPCPNPGFVPASGDSTARYMNIECGYPPWQTAEIDPLSDSDLDPGESVSGSLINGRFNRHGVTRIGMDLIPGMAPNNWRVFLFETDKKGGTPPNLEITHRPAGPYTPCLDGDVEHVICTGGGGGGGGELETNRGGGDKYGQDAIAACSCSDCLAGNLSVNTTGTTALVENDGDEADMCGDNQVVLVFDASEIPADSRHVIASASLSFTVQANEGANVDTPRIHVHSETTALPCPSGFGAQDFVGCDGPGFLAELVVTGTGEVTLSIPSPETTISRTGLTKFVLVDASDYTNPSGWQRWTLHMSEATDPNVRPRLEVTFD